MSLSSRLGEHMFDFCATVLGVAAAGLGEAARPPRSSADLAPTAAAADLPACHRLGHAFQHHYRYRFQHRYAAWMVDTDGTMRPVPAVDVDGTLMAAEDLKALQVRPPVEDVTTP
jgi:hypothetical protein